MFQKDLLGLKDSTKEFLDDVFANAQQMKELLLSGKKSSLLEGKTVFLLFYEVSTRTSSSFDQAAKTLGAKCINLSLSSSSINKGETLVDTGKNLDFMKADVMVIRHQIAGAPALLAQNVKASVINAGDGLNEHPTQALLDMMTMKEHWGDFKGRKIAIIGDVKHSRVARSNIWGLSKMGAQVYIYGPSTLMPKSDLTAKVAKSMEEAVEGADAVMGLRLQLERQDKGMFPSIAEYHRYYGINKQILKLAKPNVLVMHPGPLNRGAEIDTTTAESDNSVILPQVTNGVAVRMAILKMLTGAEETPSRKIKPL